jgi:FKBP-type peptidyl-prolyl cis-trans isomerase FklB
MNIGQVPVLFLGLFLLSVICEGADSAEPKIDKVKINYSIGYQVGTDMKHQGIEINTEALLKGVGDGVSEKEPLLTRQKMREILIDLQKQIVRNQEHKVKEEAAKNLAEGEAFLAENRKKTDVVSLPSGLQYKVIMAGSGSKPKPEDTVSVHYRGTFIDGREFDSSISSSKPATFRADHVIQGWKEALPLMEQGSKWQLFVPPVLAYGERRNGIIGPNSTLIFEIELVSINRN